MFVDNNAQRAAARKANSQRLAGCARHEFRPRPTSYANPRPTYACINCGGIVDALAFEHFQMEGASHAQD